MSLRTTTTTFEKPIQKSTTHPRRSVHHTSFLWALFQEFVRSTTQRRGRATNPRGGNSFSQSTATPSLAHCSAHAISISSGAGLRGRSTSYTVHPKDFSTQ